MAIKTCPECGNKISDRAEICPHCGLPRRFFDLPNADTIVIPSQDKFPGGYKSIKAKKNQLAYRTATAKE